MSKCQTPKCPSVQVSKYPSVQVSKCPIPKPPNAKYLNAQVPSWLNAIMAEGSNDQVSSCSVFELMAMSLSTADLDFTYQDLAFRKLANHRSTVFKLEWWFAISVLVNQQLADWKLTTLELGFEDRSMCWLLILTICHAGIHRSLKR